MTPAEQEAVATDGVMAAIFYRTLISEDVPAVAAIPITQSYVAAMIASWVARVEVEENSDSDEAEPWR